MKKIILLFIFASLMAGCSKSFLDRGPKDALSPLTFWKSKKDADLALTGIYSGFEGGNNLLYKDCGSDNSYNNFPWEGWRPIGDGTVSPSNPGNSYFDYSTIIRCNEFLESAKNIPINNLNEYLAQVRFIRAYQYYTLTTNYGDVPLVTEVFPSPEASKVPRDPKEKVQSFIETELKAIIPMLPASYSSAEFGKATKGAAQALLARFYLYYGKYAEALATAKSITGYSLFPSYEGLFNIENEQNPEIILSVQQTPDLYSMDFTPFLPNSVGGWSSVVPTQSLVDAYEIADGTTITEAAALGNYNTSNPYVNRDPRLRATVIYPGALFFGANTYSSIVAGNEDYYNKADNASKTGYNYRKYMGSFDDNTSYWNMGSDIYIFRYAEVLLTIAEAKTELGQIDDELYNGIDAVRQRAGMPKTDRIKYNNQSKLRELVRRERRVEFAGEGLRRDDIIRWKLASSVMNGQLTGVKKGAVLGTTYGNGDYNVNLSLDGNVIENRTFAEKNQLLPIPQSALDKNAKLTQNIGY
jgi:hypothetical protein